MQLTGQERIAAPRQKAWETLYDPEVLKRCIPGCQSLTKEADDRLRAIAEIKIGPIGARFNTLVTRSDLDPPHGYTMRIEGQGGTVGFIKGDARLRFTDDPSGGTLLSYQVNAEVGGRLAQLGGPILDATAKQLSTKFFRQLSTVVGAPPAPASAPMPAAVSGEARSARTRSPIAWVLAVCLAALVGYWVGHAGGANSDWMGLALGLVVVIVAAASFEFGRRSATPVLSLDPALWAKIARALDETKR